MRRNWAFLITITILACEPRVNTEEGYDDVADMKPKPAEARWTGSTGEPNPDYRPTGLDGATAVTDMGAGTLSSPDMRVSGPATPPDLAPLPSGRVAGEPCTADASCASSICIGVGEPFDGVCVARLCTVDDDCPVLRGMHRPCKTNVYKDKGSKPLFCVP